MAEVESSEPENPETQAAVALPLTEPAEGTPEVIVTTAQLENAVARLAAGNGPVAADAERASGFRYSQRAYLVQLRRAGAGTFLIDPIALPDLQSVGAALGDAEWVFHAGNQDLPGLHELGLFPAAIFDTEVAARLLNLPRVGLAAVVAQFLGWQLAKEHSAADWSKRPLPEGWLRYAALDVEVLIELRNLLHAELQSQGKLEWAQQEFEAIRLAPPAPARVEPWRRISGLHAVRERRGLAIAHALWLARDRIAQITDIAPGRVLPDRAIVSAALTAPRSVPQLKALPEFAGKTAGRRVPQWQQAIDKALALSEAELPTKRAPATDAPPHPRAWAERAPGAEKRLVAAKEVISQAVAQVDIPAENLLQPDALRRLCWTPPKSVTPQSVTEFLRSRGARPWQCELLAADLARALATADAETD